MQKTAIILMLITILSKVFGFGRELVMAYFYGTDIVAQTFVIAMTIPTVLYNFIGTGVMTGYIPMLSKIEKEQGVDAGYRFTSNMANHLLLLSMAFFIAGIVFARPLVRIFALGFGSEQIEMAVYLTRFMMLAVFGLGISAVYRGYLNQKGSFIVPASTGFIMNAFTITAIALSAWRKDLLILAFGAGIAQIVQYVFFIPAVRKTGYKHTFRLNTKDPNLHHMVILALPIIMGVAVTDLNTLIDRTLSSIFAENGVAVLNYANRMLGFVSGIVIVSMSTAIFPTLSRMATDKNLRGMKRTFADSISMMNLLVIPAVIGFMLYAEPIVRLLFVRGQFTIADGIQTGGALFWYAPCLIGIAYRDVLSRMFFSLHDTRTPAVNSLLMVILNVILSVSFAQFMGLNGLVLGTTVATLLGALMLLYTLRVRIRSLHMARIVNSTVRILLASAVMGGASYAAYVGSAGFIGSGTVRLMAAIAVAVIVYVPMLFVFRVEEASQFWQLLRRRMGRG